jgi:hypothetical protein
VRWSVTVMDILGRPVEISFDSDKRAGCITVEKEAGVFLRTHIAAEQFRSIVNVLTGWPVGGPRE